MMLRPWILAVLAVAALCSACTEEWTGWDDVPTATLTPTAPAAHHAEWSAYVADQVSMWASVLTPLGCPTPFVVGEGGHVTELVETKDWSYDEGIAAMTTDMIEVREAKTGGVRHSALLLHEMGHAMGLDHADPSFGESIMTAKPGSALAPRDIAAAACKLGCRPCDPDADPYSIAP